MNFDQIRDVPDIVMEFLEYHSTVRGHSDLTVSGYYHDLKILFRYLKRRRHLVDRDLPFNEIDITDVDLQFIKDIKIEELYRYQSFSPETTQSLSAASRCRRTSTVKSFFNYLTTKRHLLDYNVCQELDMPKRQASLPRYLEESECERLLAACDGPYALRDYCILMLFLSCGLRVSELVSLNVTDIYEDHLRVLGKGNKERMVYLNNACIEALNSYLEVRREKPKAKDEPALFISNQNKRISKRRVQQIVENSLAAAGLDGKGITTHKLRHTAATLMYQYGDADVLTLKELLGHANISTTEIYTHLNNESVRQAVESNPLANVKNDHKEDT